MKNLIDKMYSGIDINNMKQIIETMKNFEKIFDDLEVNCNMMNEVLDDVNTNNDKEVKQLIDEKTDSIGMKEINELDDQAGSNPIQNQQKMEG